MRYFLIFLVFLYGCKSKEPVTPSEKEVVKVVERTVRVKDSVLVTLPKIIEKNATRDTVSVISNKYARSSASIDTAGLLKHILETFPAEIPAEIDKDIKIRDSIVYKDRRVPVPYKVPAELTWWQRVKCDTWVILFLILGIVLYITKLHRNV